MYVNTLIYRFCSTEQKKNTHRRQLLDIGKTSNEAMKKFVAMLERKVQCEENN